MALLAPQSGEALSADTLGSLLRSNQSNTLIRSAGAAALRGPNGTLLDVRAETEPGANRPKFSGDLEHDIIVGEPLSLQLTAEPFAYLYGAADRAPLPTGLSLNTATGLITGAAQAPGDYFPVVWARNSRGARSADLILHAAMPALPYVADQSAIGQVGETFSYQIEVGSEAGTPRTFLGTPAYAISGMPEGLALDPDSGLITGTPVASLSPVALNLSVSNASGTAMHETAGRLPLLTLTIRPPAAPRITSPPDAGAFVDTQFDYYFSTSSDAFLWEVDAGTPLPAGLAMDYSATPWLPPPASYEPLYARITGIPTDPGVYEILVKAGGQAGWGPQFLLTISVGTKTPQILAGSPPEWDLADGPLELDLEINASNGPLVAFEERNVTPPLVLEDEPPETQIRYLRGTITAAGTYSAEIRAANAFGWGEWLAVEIIAFDSRAPVITHDGTESGEALTTKEIPIVASNTPTSYGCALVAGSAIVSVVGSTAKVTCRAAGDHVVRLSATNAYGTAYKDVVVTASAASFSLTASVGLDCGVDYDGEESISVTGIGPIQSYSASGKPSGLSIHSDGGIHGQHNYDPTKTYPRVFNCAVSVQIAGEWFAVGTTVFTMTAAVLDLTMDPSSKTTANPVYSENTTRRIRIPPENVYVFAVSVGAGSQAGNPQWGLVKSGGPSGNAAHIYPSLSGTSGAGATLSLSCPGVNTYFPIGVPPPPENDSPPDYLLTVTLKNDKGSGTCVAACTHNDPTS